jgi:hypothetical protein
MQGHTHQGNGFSLPSGDQHVHFATGWFVIDFIGQTKEFICLIAYGAHN